MDRSTDPLDRLYDQAPIYEFPYPPGEELHKYLLGLAERRFRQAQQAHERLAADRQQKLREQLESDVWDQLGDFA